MPSYEYIPAAKRHLNDAEELHQAGHRGNADHLYGFAAECALSAVVVQLGWDRCGLDGLEGDFRLHIDQQWNRLILYAQGRSSAAALAGVLGENPFRDWRVQDRYAARGRDDEKVVMRHKRGAETMLRVMDRVRLGGAKG